MRMLFWNDTEEIKRCDVSEITSQLRKKNERITKEK